MPLLRIVCISHIRVPGRRVHSSSKQSIINPLRNFTTIVHAFKNTGAKFTLRRFSLQKQRTIANTFNLSPLRRRTRKSLPRIRRVLHMANRHKVPRNARITIIRPRSTRVVKRTTPSLPRTSSRNRNSLVIINRSHNRLITSSRSTANLSQLVRVVIKRSSQVKHHSTAFLRHVTPTINPNINNQPHQTPRIGSNTVPRVRRIRNRPTSTVPFNISSLVVTISRAATRRSRQRIFKGIFRHNSTNPVMFMSSRSNQPSQRTRTRAHLSKFRIKFVRKGSIRRRPTPSHNNLRTVVHFKYKRDKQINNRRRRKVRLPIQWNAHRSIELVTRLTSNFNSTFTLILNSISNTIRVPKSNQYQGPNRPNRVLSRQSNTTHTFHRPRLSHRDHQAKAPSYAHIPIAGP